MLLHKLLSYRILPLLLICLFAVTLCFCKRGASVNADLFSLDSLIQCNPDSGYHQLEKYDKRKLVSKADSALFDILWAEARYKTYHDDTTSSALKPAEEYFRATGDCFNLMRTLYYKGLACHNKGANGEALVCFDEALENADSKHILYKASIYSAMGSVARAIHDWNLGLFATRNSWELFNQLDSLYFIEEAQMEYGMALVMNGQPFGSRLIHEAAVKALEKKDTALYRDAQIYLTKAYLWNHNYDSARLSVMSFHDFDNIRDLSLNDRNTILLALMKGNGSRHSIDSLAKTIIAKEGLENLIYEYFESNNDYLNAFKSLKKEHISNEQQYSKVASSDANYLRSILREERIKSMKEELRLSNQRNLWILIGLVLTVIGTIVTVKLVISIKNNKLRSALDTVRSLNLSIDSISERLNKETEKNAASSISPTLSQLFGKLDHLYAEYYRLPESQQSGKGVMMAIKEEVDYIRHSEEFLKDMEKEINRSTDDLLNDIFSKMRRVSPNQRRLTVLLYHHFSNDSICLILDIKPDVFYNRKTRLKKSIEATESSRTQELLDILFKP